MKVKGRVSFKHLGELPPGDWLFCLIEIADSPDALLIVERTGRHPPYMVIDGKLKEAT